MLNHSSYHSSAWKANRIGQSVESGEHDTCISWAGASGTTGSAIPLLVQNGGGGFLNVEWPMLGLQPYFSF